MSLLGDIRYIKKITAHRSVTLITGELGLFPACVEYGNSTYKLSSNLRYFKEILCFSFVKCVSAIPPDESGNLQIAG